MLNLPAAVRVFVCTRPTDMRRSFDGLAMLAEEVVKEDPYSGHLFVYRNRRGDRVKILYWDRSGLAIWYKRLEEGTFQIPLVEGSRKEIEACELAMMLEGIDMESARRQKRYRLPVARQPGRTLIRREEV